MNTRVAKFLSYLFHPLLMPTFLLGLLLGLAPVDAGIDFYPPKLILVLLLMVFVYTFLLPSLCVYAMVQLKMVKDLTLQHRQERRYPFLITLATYLAATYFFGWRFNQISELAPLMRVVLGSITISIAAVLLISNFWQISAHMTGLGGVTGTVLMAIIKFGTPSLFPALLASVLISGWVAASRLQLNAHNMSEVLAGFLLGNFICGLGALLFL
ncbi:hypothetical protein GCM10023091_00710 [Ravibacter arvi]|uniref:PAP2 superfamily protein n=1 Tax=Ravibacter arvi TaxID=2051041 RepID=A0ABP8LLV7_9BACT